MESSSLLFFEPGIADALDPRSLSVACIESGRRGLLLGAGVIPAQFFDLSSGFLGELLHQLTKYGVFPAAVVPDPNAYLGSFRDFVQEANRGTQAYFAPSRDEAVAWLKARLEE